MDCSIDQRSGRAMTEVSIAVRFWRRVDAMMAQGEGLLRKFRQPLEGTIFRIPTLTLVAAAMRRRMDAILLPGKLGAHKIRQLLSCHKALTVAVAGVIGLALILLLL